MQYKIPHLHDLLSWQEHHACRIWCGTGLYKHASALLMLGPLHTCTLCIPYGSYFTGLRATQVCEYAWPVALPSLNRACVLSVLSTGEKLAVCTSSNLTLAKGNLPDVLASACTYDVNYKFQHRIRREDYPETRAIMLQAGSTRSTHTHRRQASRLRGW